MARPSKLSQAQCDRIRMLKTEGAAAPELAKRFKLSESSIYKILNGSYTAAPPGKERMPPTVPVEDRGSTPSLFDTSKPSGRKGANSNDQQVESRVRDAAGANRQSVEVGS